jgi:serine protease
MKRVGLLCVVLLLAASAFAKTKPEKIRKHPLQGVRDQYIVVLQEGTDPSQVEAIAKDMSRDYGVQVGQIFAWALQGFVVNAKEKQIEELTADDRIEYIEQNATGKADFESPDAAPTVSAMQWSIWNNEYLWNLDRIDETSWANRDSQHNMCTEGRGAVAYIIDTGIWPGHSEFQEPVPSRLVASLDFVGAANGATDTNVGCGAPTTNLNAYHGTAVASVLAGTHIGAAKTQMVSLRVFGCDGSANTIDFIEALDWIAGPSNPYRTSPGVINHSGYVPITDANFYSYGDAVVRTVNSTNIPFFTSADNYSTDACRFSPNNRPYTRTSKLGRAFVVGGTIAGASAGDPNDYRWQEWDTVNGQPVQRIGGDSGSNGGPCVSIYAPAAGTYVALYSGATNYIRLSGTSFASPLVAALAARYMEKTRNQTGVIPTATQVYEWLLTQSTTVVQNTNTAPTYWMCLRSTATQFFPGNVFRTYPGANACPTGYTLVEMNSATNSSDARHAYWDEGYCP